MPRTNAEPIFTKEEMRHALDPESGDFVSKGIMPQSRTITVGYAPDGKAKLIVQGFGVPGQIAITCEEHNANMLARVLADTKFDALLQYR